MKYMPVMIMPSEFEKIILKKCIDKKTIIKNAEMSKSTLEKWLKCDVSDRNINFLKLMKNLNISIDDMLVEMDFWLEAVQGVEEVTEDVQTIPPFPSIMEKQISELGISKKMIANQMKITNKCLNNFIYLRSMGTIPSFIKFIKILELNTEKAIEIIERHNVLNDDTSIKNNFEIIQNIILHEYKTNKIEKLSIDGAIEYRGQLQKLLEYTQKIYELRKQTYEKNFSMKNMYDLFLNNRSEKEKLNDNEKSKQYDETIIEINKIIEKLTEKINKAIE